MARGMQSWPAVSVVARNERTGAPRQALGSRSGLASHAHLWSESGLGKRSGSGSGRAALATIAHFIQDAFIWFRQQGL